MSLRQPSRWSGVAARLVTLLLLLSILFGVIVLVKGVVGAVAGGQDVALHREIHIDTIEPLPPHVVGPSVIPLTVRVKDADTDQALYAMFRDLLPAVVAVAILWLLRAILGSVRSGDPFTWGNVRRLRAIGFVLLIGGPVAEVTRAYLESALSSTVGATGSGLAFNVPLAGPIASLFIFVLAQVFADGVRLHEDVEGTV